jgi:hypothetical protein
VRISLRGVNKKTLVCRPLEAKDKGLVPAHGSRIKVALTALDKGNDAQEPRLLKCITNLFTVKK